MSTDLNAGIIEAFRKRALADMQARILGDGRHAVAARRLAAAQEQLRQEVEDFRISLREGEVDEKDLTPVQQRIRDAITQYGAQVEALLQALADRDADDDGKALEASVSNLIGSMMGRMLALEARVAALEAAVAGD